MSVSVAMIIVPVMPVGPVFVAVVFMVPMSFVVLPAFPVVIVMRMRPIGAGIRWLLVAPGDPTVVVTLRHPATTDPNHSNYRRGRWRRFHNDRRRRDADI